MADIHQVELLARWRTLRAELANRHVQLLAVSKYAGDGDVAALIAAGQKDYCESRPQQLRDRAQVFPEIHWHMIGPMQKNKAKYVARHAAVWHSVECGDTARAVASQVIGRRLPVMLQVNVAGFPHQHGVLPEALPALTKEVIALPQLMLAGLMCMAPRDADARPVFARLRGLRDALLNGSLCNNEAMPRQLKLCMGMSGDYRAALAEGTDMVRIGSGLFGSRAC